MLLGESVGWEKHTLVLSEKENQYCTPDPENHTLVPGDLESPSAPAMQPTLTGMAVCIGHHRSYSTWSVKINRDIS